MLSSCAVCASDEIHQTRFWDAETQSAVKHRWLRRRGCHRHIQSFFFMILVVTEEFHDSQLSTSYFAFSEIWTSQVAILSFALSTVAPFIPFHLFLMIWNRIQFHCRCKLVGGLVTVTGANSSPVRIAAHCASFVASRIWLPARLEAQFACALSTGSQVSSISSSWLMAWMKTWVSSILYTR